MPDSGREEPFSGIPLDPDQQQRAAEDAAAAQQDAANAANPNWVPESSGRIGGNSAATQAYYNRMSATPSPTEGPRGMSRYGNIASDPYARYLDTILQGWREARINSHPPSDKPPKQYIGRGQADNWPPSGPEWPTTSVRKSPSNK